ncbi:MAG: hypothetical protein CL624_05120 [Arcobacter sp.]|nr:hypothetical protein [Arcobacter sp.]|tara:strand:+ start:1564 stop:1953 length:390 start_codon:yes stop_codon:yes gene_type:complete
MKNKFIVIALLALFFTNLNAYSTQIKAAHAIGIFHENGKGENIQHVRKTKDDYNGICFSKIVVFGKLNNIIPKVKIGNSLGKFIKEIPIYNKHKIKIAKEITFKHYNVTKGYIEVRVDKKLYDSKVFVK